MKIKIKNKWKNSNNNSNNNNNLGLTTETHVTSKSQKVSSLLAKLKEKSRYFSLDQKPCNFLSNLTFHSFQIHLKVIVLRIRGMAIKEWICL